MPFQNVALAKKAAMIMRITSKKHTHFNWGQPMKRTFLLSATLIALSSAPALAHTGHTATDGLTSGLAHPFLGADHLLAMVAVGLFAVQSGGVNRFLLPLLFVGTMIVGGALGLSGVAVPFVEAGIVGSVILLGAAIAYGRHIPAPAAAVMVAAFALFHGVAHGTEMPADASALAYGAGMAIATAILHVMGMGVATVVPSVLRFAGGAIALSGIALAAM